MAARTSSARAARSAAASAAKSSASSARSPGTSTTRPFTTSTPAYRCSSVRTRPNTRLTRRAPSADDANAPWRARSASAAAASAARSFAPAGASGRRRVGTRSEHARPPPPRGARAGASRASRASAAPRAATTRVSEGAARRRARAFQDRFGRDCFKRLFGRGGVGRLCFNSCFRPLRARAAAMRFAPASAPASATTHVVTGAAKLGSLCAYARTGTSASCRRVGTRRLFLHDHVRRFASSPTSSSEALRLRAAPRSARRTRRAGRRRRRRPRAPPRTRRARRRPARAVRGGTPERAHPRPRAARRLA